MPLRLSRLRRAIAQGAALASAGFAAGCHEASPPTAAAPDAGEERDAAGALEPYSLAALQCTGDARGPTPGYHGACCVDARCYTPAQGSACAPAQESALRDAGVPLPPGSGSCQCGLQGPFGANPEDQPKHPGSCCYLVGSIACDGRPLRLGDVWLVAAVIPRGDWAAFT